MADVKYMARALHLAGRGLFTTDPNPRVGAVLVKDNVIVGEGWHRYTGESHAEIHAIQVAGVEASGATCYVTLEPCSHHGRTAPCAEALIEAGIKRVVIAMEDPNPQVSGSGISRLKKAGIEVVQGVMETEAQALNPGFIRRMQESRPWIVAKLAMSIDGRTAMASGESQWISSVQSREDVQRLRARVSAIITGSGTLLADNPRMTVRPEAVGFAHHLLGEKCRQPLRVVLDGQQRLSPKAQFFTGEGRSLIVLPDGSLNRVLFEDADVEVMEASLVDGHFDLKVICRRLALEWQVNELLVEAGAELSGAFLQAGLIDELHLYVAPKLMGENAKGLFHLPGLETMKQCKHLEFSQIRQLGTDVKIICKLK